MNRIDRLMSIVWMLQSRKYVSLTELQQKFQLSERTVYRDIKSLNEIGIPVYFEPDNGYTIMPGHFLPPLLFTMEEANALLLMRHLAVKYSDPSITTRIDGVLEKMSMSSRFKHAEKLDEILHRMEVYTVDNSIGTKNHLTHIQSAILNKQILEINYTDNQGSETLRQIEPIGMIFYTQQWHLIAWCWLRNAYRDFKVGQISALDNPHVPFRKAHTYTIQDYMKIF